MGRYDTATVTTLVAVVHDGTSYPAGAVLTVPAGTAVRWLMHKQATMAPKGSVPTASPSPPARPERPSKKGKASPPIPPSEPPPAAPDAAEDRTYQRRDLVPEE